MFEITQPKSGVDRRTASRAQVAFPTRWDHRRLEDQPGELLDVSTTGLFLRPSGGTVRFRPNDVVWGSLEIEGQSRVFSGIVRWRGWSRGLTRLRRRGAPMRGCTGWHRSRNATWPGTGTRSAYPRR